MKTKEELFEKWIEDNYWHVDTSEAAFLAGWDAAMQRAQELQNNNKLMEEILNVSQLSTDKEGSI